MIYDGERHRYSDGERVIPSVTQILSPPSRWYAPGSAERGTRIHLDCVNWAKNPDSAIQGNDFHSDAFILWHFRRSPRLLASEEMVDHVAGGKRYAGRFDLLMEIDGDRVLVDIKTGNPAKWHEAQIAAYALAVKPDRCLLLYLRKDMTYVESWLSPHALADGIAAFLQALEDYA